MNKLSLIFLLIVLPSCEYPFSNINETKWAIVEQQKIEKIITSLIKNQNPYPDEYQYVGNINNDFSTKKSQISRLEHEAKLQCSLDNDKNAETNNSPEAHGMGGVTMDSSGRVYGRQYSGAYNAACIANINDDQLIADLKKKLDHIQSIRFKQNLHNSNIVKLAKEKTLIIISTYANDKFDLVVRKNTSPVFNKTGLTLDITQAVINEINAKPLIIQLPPIQ